MLSKYLKIYAFTVLLIAFCIFQLCAQIKVLMSSLSEEAIYSAQRMASPQDKTRSISGYGSYAELCDYHIIIDKLAKTIGK